MLPVGLRKYEVTVPPTSKEVEERVFNALANNKKVFLSLREVETDIPSSQNIDSLEFRIAATFHPEDCSVRVIGRTAVSNIDDVNLSIYADPQAPATLYLVA